MVAPPHRTSPIVRPARHDGRAHANLHSAHRAIGTLMTIPRFPSHPLHSRRPSITRVRNCFLAQMGVAHKPIAYPAILALHRSEGTGGAGAHTQDTRAAHI